MALRGIPADSAMLRLTEMVADIIVFDQQLAYIAADMLRVTKPFGLSLGDRACLATAASMNLEAVTADKVWSQIKGVAKIRLIR